MAATFVAISLAGCAMPPVISPRPTSTTGESPAGPKRTSTPSVAPSGGLAVETVRDWGVIPDTAPALQSTTDGSVIVFSGGAGVEDGAHAPDLYAAMPGEPARLLFHNPDRDSDLLPVAVGGGWVAFGEANLRTLGDQAWILWLLPLEGGDRVELDRNPVLHGSPYPVVAVNERHVVWQAFHETDEGERSQLIHVLLPDLVREILFSADPTRYQWWEPALDGDRLVYTEVDYVAGDPGSAFKPAELYAKLLDLSSPAHEPVRLDASGRATEPAISGSTVVWKEADNVFIWGSLSVHSLTDGTTRFASVSPQSGIKTPSVGNRYVAFWGIDDTEFYLYDLKLGTTAKVLQMAPDSELPGALRPEVTGDLLVWLQGTDVGAAVAWARLPTMDDP